MSLKARLIAQIAQDGPMTVAQYMTACLHDPADGYYATRPRLGAGGDFITAPVVSQMFGELLGLWAFEVWDRMGRPAPFVLAEMGPGDGTLMVDALRAVRLVPAFLEAADLWLIETSPVLRRVQAERLADAAPRWAASVDELPQAPLILLSNELIDCLPVRQFVRTERGWCERRIGVVDGALAFGLSLDAPIPAETEAPVGAVLEVAAAHGALGQAVGARIAQVGGAALFIDYGRDAPGFGDTFQALIGHEKVSPLDRPGEADLTVHADFPAFVRGAMSAGVEASRILGQGDFLVALGIEARAAALSRARPESAQTLARQLERLLAPAQMGSLFKAVAVHSPGLAVPGFGEPA